jgi:hypothetical protein
MVTLSGNQANIEPSTCDDKQDLAVVDEVGRE